MTWLVPFSEIKVTTWLELTSLAVLLHLGKLAIMT